MPARDDFASADFADAAPETTTAWDPVPSWRLGFHKGPQRAWNRRMTLLTAGILAITSLTGMLTWATSRIGVAPHITVTVAGTDYRDNLRIAPNAFGDRAVGRLASWTTAERPSARRSLQLTGQPIHLRRATDFLEIDTDPNASICLLFISAHGISTPAGPALLPADASRPDDGYLVRELLRTIAAFPADQRKVLMLDCTQLVSAPAWGLVLNDFIRQLEGLESEIEAIPNLVVLTSSDRDRRSWIDPAAGTTRWAQSILEGLNGRATDVDQDGWIDIVDLFLFARRQTDGWTQQICGQSQHPLLLPQGKVGFQRAADTILFPEGNRPLELSTLVLPTRHEPIDQWWTRHQQMTSQHPSPRFTDPVQWRRFEQTLLRFEYFELAGCRTAADHLERQLWELAGRLTDNDATSSIAARVGVIAPQAAGLSGTQPLAAKAEPLEKLFREMTDQEVAERWLEVIDGEAEASSVAGLRRAVIAARIESVANDFRDQAKVDRDRLNRAATLVQTIADPLQPVPQAGLVLQLLARDLPADACDSRDATRVARCLELALRGDRVSRHDPWWTAQLYPWVTDAVHQADHHRRLAGDLLMGAADARQRSETHLQQAERLYGEVDQLVATLTEAAELQHGGPAALQRVARCIADRSITKPLFANATPPLKQLTAQVEHAYQLLETLDQILLREPPSAKADREAALQRLADHLSEYRHLTERLQQHVDRWQQDTLAATVPSLPAALAALQICGESGSNRRAAWQRLHRFAANTLPDANREAQPDTKPDTKPGTKLGAKPGTPAADSGEAIVQEGAALRGRLALAAWPARAWDALMQPQQVTHAQITHRLEVFRCETHWWRSLQTAGWQLGTAEARVLEQHATPTTKATSSKATASTSPFWRSVCWLTSRVTSPPAAWTDEVRRCREQQLSQYLRWQAERFRQDGYWSLRPEGPSYHTRVDDLLTDDIATLTKQALPPGGTVAPEAAVQIDSIDRLVWTTQQTDSFQVTVRSPADRYQGFATLSVQGNGALQVVQPLAGKPIIRPLAVAGPVRDPRTPAAADGLMVHLRPATPPSATATAPTPLVIEAYFRGRRLQHRIAVSIASTPDIQISRSPSPATGTLAVCAPSPTGHGHGAVALVLDCSGSMGADRGQPFDQRTKYAQAVDAVETLLKDLPAGITLSVWAFGQAVGPDKTVEPAERSITRIRPPARWDPNDTAAQETLLRSIRYPTLEPWNESPLMAAMLTAAEDLRDHPGPRSLVVITDGADNRVETDAVTNPLGLSPRDLLKKRFRGTGVTVNVIAFRVDAEEQLPAKRQFGVVEQMLPAGRFVQVDQMAELADALHALLSISPGVVVQQASSSKSSAPATQATLPLSPATQPLHWTPPLASGLYTVSSTDHGSGRSLQIDAGDRLVLQRSADGGWHRYPHLDREFSWCPQQQAGRWQVGLVPVPLANSQRVRKQLRLWAPSNGTLAIERPGEVWIEAHHQQTPLSLHWSRNLQQPGLVFDLEVETPAHVQPAFNIWIDERPANSVGSVIRDRDFKHLADLAPASWQLSEGTVHLRSAAIETHAVPDETGAIRDQPCFVLRGAGPPGNVFRFRTVGLNVRGQDEQCFTGLGEWTLRQWPVTQATAEAALHAVELISVDQFRRDAGRAGGRLQFDNATTSAPASPPLVQHQRRGR